ncbi:MULTISPECIES: hypothetical protein [unclassified Nonomuraea]|uniref:hypothetical protein n=1 Tax=unclassified Nonomuraea TaxID=2593643 RepID=UPI0033C528EC
MPARLNWKYAFARVPSPPFQQRVTICRIVVRSDRVVLTTFLVFLLAYQMVDQRA